MTVTWDHVRTAMNQAVMDRGEWAGAPMPVRGLKLVVEPRYPYQGLNGFCLEDETRERPEASESSDEEVRVINSWYCPQKHAEVYVWTGNDGRSRVSLLPAGWPMQRLHFAINTIGASEAWDVHAESKAIRCLMGLVTETAFRSYFTTGAFLETSQRSKVTYIFRRCRPTLAMRPNRHGNMTCIAALCLHPIGYYEESYAGCMVPTDDVIAHLLMMRGNERKFWGKANHHPLWSANAGV